MISPMVTESHLTFDVNGWKPCLMVNVSESHRIVADTRSRLDKLIEIAGITTDIVIENDWVFNKDQDGRTIFKKS